MTEAYRSETQPRIGIQPTPGISIDIPLALDHSMDADPITPRASTLKRTSGRTSLRATLTFGTALAFGAAGIGAVSAQEPSAAPSFGASFEPTPSITPDPITGLLPCPTPTPEPGETPLPDRTIDPNIGHVGGEAFAQTGADVFIAAQAEPSAIPSKAPELSPAPSITPNPETAVNPDCEPEFDPANYTIDALVAKGYDPMKKNEYMKVVRQHIPDILVLTRNVPAFDEAHEVESLYEQGVNDLISNPLPGDFGVELLVGSINNEVNLASSYASTDIVVADALMALADADRRIGHEYIKFGTKKPKKIDAAMDKLIIENK